MKIQFARAARQDAESIGGLKLPYAPAKRALPPWRWYLLLAAVGAPVVLLALGMLSGVLTRSAQGTVSLDQLEVRALGGGRVTTVAVTPGQSVRAGDALADTREAGGASASSLTTIVAPGPHSGAPRNAAAELALKARGLRLATERRDSVAALLSAGAATQAELREADYALDQASAEYLRAERDLAGSAGSSLVRSMREQTAAGNAIIANRAPFAGRVLDVYITPGEIVRAGDPLVLIGRESDPKIVAYVPPDFATRLQVGAIATILFADGSRALAQVTEPARVTRRMPADLVDNFGMRPMMVVLKLGTQSPWPASQAIHGMPVRIRFHYAWEEHALGRWAGSILNLLTGKP